MAETDLRAEIEALRGEIAALRAEQAATGRASGTKAESAPGTADFGEELRTLADEILAFAEDPEKGIASRPFASVLGALILGILIGRVIH
jgi:hypothetical protein